MKLIGTLTSPYTRKARVVLAEKRVEYDFIIDSPDDRDAQLLVYNPLGKIPVLVLDDGVAIFDSRVIVEYLDNASPVARLIPEDTRHRIQVKRWEALADGCTDAVVAVVTERRRRVERQSSAWFAHQQGKIDRALKAMSQELADRAWCSGDHYNLSDIAVGCCLDYLELRLPQIQWRKLYPNLARLSERLVLRPSFRDLMLSPSPPREVAA